MVETPTSQSPSVKPAIDHESAGISRAVTSDRIVWAVLSFAFLVFLLLGSVQARIWRFGQLKIESKSIIRIWQVQAENLPRIAWQWLMQATFYGAVVVFIACVIVGLRFLLDHSGDDIA